MCSGGLREGWDVPLRISEEGKGVILIQSVTEDLYMQSTTGKLSSTTLPKYRPRFSRSVESTAGESRKTNDYSMIWSLDGACSLCCWGRPPPLPNINYSRTPTWVLPLPKWICGSILYLEVAGLFALQPTYMTSLGQASK